MSVNASESVSPLGESQVTARRKRLYHLSRMVMNLKAEWRYPGGKNREFDGVEDEGLIEALRVSGSYIDLIDPLLAGDPFEDQVVIIKAIDGYDYIINFSNLRTRVRCQGVASYDHELEVGS